MEPEGHHGQNGPFTRSNIPGNTTFYGDPEFRCHFCQKLIWTSVKTLVMEPAGRHDEKGPFTRSNEPQSSPQHFMVTRNSDLIFAKNLHGPLLRH
ncbi:hypothetical protein H5410_049316 [Solanum commersonii]|uniref:Uncharacterized protein n=1 Tax=Solanum commersonii TaxID=4109 RepID=A0A9J5WS78_SOLCO|nr:hypothetical protein H5410_049316 [Solanum commersonii]